MDERVTLPSDELERLQQRARKLAQEKSYLQLVNDLMAALSEMSGLEHTVDAITRLILEKIGGAAVSIYCWANGELVHGDAFGVREVLEAPDDDMVRAVFASGRPVEERRDFADSKMLLPAFTNASSWAVPLQVGERLIGVVKMDGMLISAEEMATRFQPFFRYAALVLKNEIESYELLERMNADLRAANERLVTSEAMLRTVNEELEQRVASRTAELDLANQQLRLELAERRRAEEALARLNRELRALSECNQVLIRATDEGALLRDICRIACEQGGYRMAWVGYPEQDEARTVRPAAMAGVDDGYLEEARITWAEAGGSVAGTALRTGVTSGLEDVATSPPSATWRDKALARGYRSGIGLPLRNAQGDPFGVLTIYSTEVAAFIPEEVRLLEELAGDLAFGIGVLRAREAHARLEAQLRQAQKMEVVGQLAGGIAHDFNNLLTAINGYGELLRAELPPDDAVSRDDLDEMLAAAGRAGLLTRQLLAFARRQVLVPVVLRPAEVMARIAPMLRRLLGEQIEFSTSAARGGGRVRVDPGQLEQVILNLAVNARDAMPGGGRLAIGTADVDLDEGAAAMHPGTVPGRYVALTVTDTGVGMDAGTQAHLFEPFFTTKPEGLGTGLGLATVHGIVNQSGGAISVQSEPGLGTTIRVHLPRVNEDAGAADATDGGPDVVPSGSETILLVEDDPAVRAYAGRALRGFGYTVLEARTGVDALALAATHAGPLDLLLTDVVMPGMQGLDLARRLATTHPATRVLFMSGFAGNEPGQAGQLTAQAFLPKPFSSEALARAVRAVLDAGAR